MRRLRFFLPTACLGALALSLPAQVRVRAAGGVIIDGGQGGEGIEQVGEDGYRVKVHESVDLDRYLLKAQEFLANQAFADAIKVLQDVLDGRAIEKDPKDPKEPKDGAAVRLIESADQVMFAKDGRLCVPVTGFCHQLLASMPEEAIQLYRSRHDAEARRLFDKAIANRDLEGLDEVIRRFFVSSSGDDALDAAGDVLMDMGRYRRAIARWETLLELYPADSDRPLEYVLTKVAFCYARLGEGHKAAEALTRLEQKIPNAAVRLAGELHSIAQLRTHPWFSISAAPPTSAMPGKESGDVPPEPTYLANWIYRFDDKNPYQPPKKSSEQYYDGSSTMLPKPSHAPGASVLLLGDQLLVKEHDRTLALEFLTGRLLQRTDQPGTAPSSANKMFAVRNPHFDIAGMRVHTDGVRCYVTEDNKGPQSGQTGITYRNSISAYELASWRRVWTTRDQVQDFKNTVFLAPPTPIDGRLVVPVLRDDGYGVLCLDAETGKLQWRAPVHSAGTPFARPPGSPLAVADGLAFFLTNAGAVAAVDVARGGVVWIRKYERLDPHLPVPKPSARAGARRFNYGVPQEVALDGFVPTQPLVAEGRVIIAPADGKNLLALDAANGELLWMNPKGKFDYVVGSNGEYLFLAGDALQCIQLRSGIRMWERPIQDTFKGRGVVTRDYVFVPVEGGVLRFTTAKDQEPVRLSFEYPPGIDPIAAPFNLEVRGEHLIVAAGGAVGVFSDLATWSHRIEKDTSTAGRLAMAELLLRAGKGEQAVSLYGELLTQARGEARDDLLRRLVNAACEESLRQARASQRQIALRLLDQAATVVGTTPEVRDRRCDLLLQRIEVFKALGDVEGSHQAREALYEFLDGQ